MSAVNVTAGQVVAVEPFAARASHQGTVLLRRQPFAGFPHRIFPFGPITGVAPLLEIGFGPFRREHAPVGFEAGASIFEGRCSAIQVLARLAAWIEAATPTPLIFIVRNTTANPNRVFRLQPKLDALANRTLSISATRMRIAVRLAKS